MSHAPGTRRLSSWKDNRQHLDMWAVARGLGRGPPMEVICASCNVVLQVYNPSKLPAAGSQAKLLPCGHVTCTACIPSVTNAWPITYNWDSCLVCRTKLTCGNCKARCRIITLPGTRPEGDNWWTRVAKTLPEGGYYDPYRCHRCRAADSWLRSLRQKQLVVGKTTEEQCYTRLLAEVIMRAEGMARESQPGTLQEVCEMLGTHAAALQNMCQTRGSFDVTQTHWEVRQLGAAALGLQSGEAAWTPPGMRAEFQRLHQRKYSAVIGSRNSAVDQMLRCMPVNPHDWTASARNA
ncbi:hypothetical protein TOPH_08369 [Tolypocladium ophioglossoides CBS 100239]|uniref:RING-type domain-containing protein n=1 Tax=Tolypocladium ophioglossoides (strain CBS 100239) TaxID=1163406 RepID=A0A0L0MZR0_TOLOC|nr:hypothetical protein TOPH_08369 [Tolypocladium ophioglossoides CBS 100239]